MSRPRKTNKGKPCDMRTPPGMVAPDVSRPEVRQRIIDDMGAAGISLAHDSRYWDEYSFPLIDEAYIIARREAAIILSTVDPLGEDPLLAAKLGQVIVGWGEPTVRNLVGNFMVHVLESYSADDAENLFKRIVRLKRNSEFHHRNKYASLAYSDYIEETGIEPTKPQLREYMMARRAEKYLDQPAAEDGKGWTRLWKASGLFALPER